MLDLPKDLPRKYRIQMRVFYQFGQWKYSYELIGQHGGIHVHISGPHHYDNEDHWSAGFEVHSRTPMYGEDAPSHDKCWLLKCPCWHDGSGLYPQETYLPMFHRGDHGAILRRMARDADDRWAPKCEETS